MRCARSMSAERPTSGSGVRSEATATAARPEGGDGTGDFGARRRQPMLRATEAAALLSVCVRCAQEAGVGQERALIYEVEANEAATIRSAVLRRAEVEMWPAARVAGVQRVILWVVRALQTDACASNDDWQEVQRARAAGVLQAWRSSVRKESRAGARGARGGWTKRYPDEGQAIQAGRNVGRAIQWAEKPDRVPERASGRLAAMRRETLTHEAAERPLRAVVGWGAAAECPEAAELCEKASPALRTALVSVGGWAIMKRRGSASLARAAGRDAQTLKRWLHVRCLPTVTACRGYSLVTIRASGQRWVARPLTALQLAAAMELPVHGRTPLRLAIEACTATQARQMVGQSVHGGACRRVMDIAVGAADCCGRVRYADAGSGFGACAAVARGVAGAAGLDFEYVFAAEANRACMRAHVAGWRRSGVRMFASSHRAEDVAAMAALGRVDVWQYSPRCAPLSPANRKPWEQRRTDVEDMLAELQAAFVYVGIARPRVVIVEQVEVPSAMGAAGVEARMEAVMRKAGADKYAWTAYVSDPQKMGGTAARRRVWRMGVRHE